MPKISKEAAAALRKIEYFEALLTQLEQRVQDMGDVDESEITRLQVYVDKLKDADAKYEESLSLSDQPIQISINFSLRCSELIASIQKLINDFNKNQGNCEESRAGLSVHEMQCRGTVGLSAPPIRLPEIQIPKFHGDFTQWTHFHEAFTALIINNTALDNITRFHYLNSSLTGEPKRLIENLNLSSANFDVAWLQLQQRYNNVRLITASYVRKLLGLSCFNGQSHSELRKLIDQVLSYTNAIRALDLPVPMEELIISQLLLDKLDNDSVAAWELNAPHDHVPSLQELMMFLEKRCKILEFINPVTFQSSQSPQSKTFQSKQLSKTPVHGNQAVQNQRSVKSTIKCFFCSQSHNIFHCKEFLNLSLQQRWNYVYQNKICKNCLRPYSKEHQCWGKCQTCGIKHHTLLHDVKAEQPQQVSFADTGVNDLDTEKNVHSSFSQPISETYMPTNLSQNLNRQVSASFSPNSLTNGLNPIASSTQMALSAIPQLECRSVLLPTAIVNVNNSSNCAVPVNTFLDTGSSVNIISQSLVDKLGLPIRHTNTKIKCISDLEVNVTKIVRFYIFSRTTQWQANIEALVMPEVIPNMPTKSFDINYLPIPPNYSLADPEFCISKPIHLLLGSATVVDILLPHKLSLGPNMPSLLNTQLGWVLMGDLPVTSLEAMNAFVGTVPDQQLDVDKSLDRFWQLEEVIHMPTLSPDETICEDFFTQTTSRNEDGRFIVRLPRKVNSPPLGRSFAQALKRFHSLERRLQSKPDLGHQYKEFMQEYSDLGHMSDVTDSHDINQGYFIPHHAVVKPTSTTTKLRVVFDASAKTSSGFSLNDTLAVGPVIQPDLFCQILNFRTRPYAFTADIAKMYRQVLLHPDDRSFHKILWRHNSSDPLQVYQLNTVTYGTAPASFLATRAVQQLASEHCNEYPTAARMLKQNLYVDDLLSGADTLHDARVAIQQICELAPLGGFQFRKWASNSPELLTTIPPHLLETSDVKSFNTEDDTGIHALGLLWKPQSDTLHIMSAVQNFSDSFTKRTFLSCVASIFDPLGLLSPVVVSCKKLLQQLWLAKIQWDEPIPQDILHIWLSIFQELKCINNISIPRFLGLSANPSDFQIHGFCDASQSAYGACVYSRQVSELGVVSINLIAAKSRVAPLKPTTVPRLELCGALLLSRLISKISKSLTLEFSSVHLWTDSQIVLAWLKATPFKLRTFEANRVYEIQTTTQQYVWRHVASKHNPADLISRGVRPSELINNKMWWCGPAWLHSHVGSWQTSKGEEIHPIVHQSVCATINFPQFPLLTRFSSHLKTIRVMAYVLRFLRNSNPKLSSFSGTLQPVELENARNKCVASLQRHCFSSEFSALSNQQQISCNSSLLPLHPYLDTQGLMRVGGRLTNSNLPADVKHQLILPPKHVFTRHLIWYHHIKLLHANTQTLIADIRQTYWIPAIRRIIKSVISKCVTCFRHNTEPLTQLMGDLPAPRVVQSFVFSNAACDFCGPFLLRQGGSRSKIMTKAYIALFVCLATKAIHLEVVSDLSTRCFLEAFNRFCARRGYPANMYSDNATNFRGAARELSQLHAFFASSQFQDELRNSTSKVGVNWHFIPPRSPHFGGLHEACVKSLKYYLKRNAANVIFNFEQFTTLTARIEALLNSRPLVALTSDPGDFNYLSPAHFLIGRPLTSPPLPEVPDVTRKCTTKWQQVQTIVAQIWRRWSKDYLLSLQQRAKWRAKTQNVDLGTLVLVREDNVPPTQWQLGVIVHAYPGKDNLIRVVKVRTASGTYMRPLVKLAPLPIE